MTVAAYKEPGLVVWRSSAVSNYAKDTLGQFIAAF